LFRGDVMLIQLLVGAAASLVNIAVHAVLTVYLDQAVRHFWTRPRALHFLWNRVLLMVAAVAILMAAHAIEVFVWVTTYVLVGAVPEGADRAYFAFVNYTTLGYGDVLPVKDWQLLGPLTAMNGILLFGWSTAAIFEVLRTTVRDPSG
jgi:Ion channel